MFRRIREKIERALERRESQRPLTSDDLRQLLSGMREELIELRGRIPRLEKQADRLQARAQEQIKRAEFAHGKAQEAESAGRSEEAHSALEAARRALSDAERLRENAAEMRGEAERLRVEAVEKLEQLKYAERNRSALLARSRRAGTARRLEDLLRGPESGVRRFEKAEEDIEAAEDLAAATRDLEEELGERPGGADFESDYEMRRLEAAQEQEDLERRLTDLKRQVEEE